MNMYRGIVKDKLGTQKDRQTRLYDRYLDAHTAVSKLEKKHGVGLRYKIDVIRVEK
jgi:hypothetical protein